MRTRRLLKTHQNKIWMSVHRHLQIIKFSAPMAIKNKMNHKQRSEVSSVALSARIMDTIWFHQSCLLRILRSSKKEICRFQQNSIAHDTPKEEKLEFLSYIRNLKRQASSSMSHHPTLLIKRTFIKNSLTCKGVGSKIMLTDLYAKAKS